MTPFVRSVELPTRVELAYTDPIDPAFARDFQQSTLARPLPARFLDTVVRESLKVPAHVWRAAFQGFLEDDFVDELDKIEAPTLILWGTRDVLCRIERSLGAGRKPAARANAVT